MHPAPNSSPKTPENAAANDALGRDDLTGAVQESESALRLANGVTTSLMAMRTESEPDAVTPETDVLRAVRGGIDGIGAARESP